MKVVINYDTVCVEGIICVEEFKEQLGLNNKVGMEHNELVAFTWCKLKYVLISKEKEILYLMGKFYIYSNTLDIYEAASSRHIVVVIALKLKAAAVILFEFFIIMLALYISKI